MALLGQAEWWLPAIAVGVLVIIALLCSQPRWRLVVVVAAIFAIGAVVWQQRKLDQDAEQLRDLTARLDAIGQLLPNSGSSASTDTYSSVAAAIGALNGRIKDLESQIGDLQQKYRSRTIDDATAAQLQDQLRPLAGQRVVISCAPQDVEAYNYANRIATILRAAGWDAPGPEPTSVFGTAPSTSIMLYVRPGQADAAKALIEAFAKTNISYKAGLYPTEGVPETTGTELYVPAKP